VVDRNDVFLECGQDGAVGTDDGYAARDRRGANPVSFHS
jgi:hypothetical protein